MKGLGVWDLGFRFRVWGLGASGFGVVGLRVQGRGAVVVVP